MVFPLFLRIEEMALYVLENFKRYQIEVAFPPLLLSYDYQELCLEFDLVEAEGVA